MQARIVSQSSLSNVVRRKEGIMGPLVSGLLAALPAALGFGSQLATNRSARKEARVMRAYNTPKQQMGRFAEAGLSPYLMYSQASSGNQTAPIPAREYGGEHAGKGIETYMGMQQFQMSQQLQRQQLWNAQKDYESKLYSGEMAQMQRDKMRLEMFADFPEWLGQDITSQSGEASFRRKLNELKIAASKATLDKLNEAVKNMGYKNTVDEVKAGYARDYGMVGGDWTQGFGLLKTGAGMFRSTKAIPGKAMSGGSKLPYANQLKVNPSPWWKFTTKNPVRRKPSRGVINP